MFTPLEDGVSGRTGVAPAGFAHRRHTRAELRWDIRCKVVAVSVPRHGCVSPCGVFTESAPCMCGCL